MKSLLFILLFALGAFAAETANGSLVQPVDDEANYVAAIAASVDSLGVVDDSAAVQTGADSLQKDRSGTQGSEVFLICDMDDVEEDPETSVKNSIGFVNDSLGPLENYVNLSEPASASGTADSAVVDSSAKDSLVQSSSSAEPVSSSSSKASKKKVFAPTIKSIPLPRQTAYIGAGLSVGIGAGIYNPTDDCDCMGIWQAQVEYFYADWISAVVDVRFLGGDLDDFSMLMYQRYRMDARVHKAWDSFDIFLEPFFSFETTSISAFREEVHKAISDDSDGDEGGSADGDSLDVEKDVCEKMFSMDGFSVGMGTGFGWRISRFLGLTGSAMMEYSFSKSALLSLTPGLALNLREFWPWGKNNLRSTWFSAEFGFQRFFNRGVGAWTTHFFVGVQVGI